MRVWIETWWYVSRTEYPCCVTLYVRVWIETILIRPEDFGGNVTLYVRVWIETVLNS